jgi:hypothetical protein
MKVEYDTEETHELLKELLGKHFEGYSVEQVELSGYGKSQRLSVQLIKDAVLPAPRPYPLDDPNDDIPM